MSTEFGETDLAQAAAHHGVNFVSAIRSYGNLGPFRPVDREYFKGIRIFDLLLRPRQTIHGSTIKPLTPSNLYGNWGIVVTKGKILQSYPYDAVSTVENGVPKSPYQDRIQHLSADEQLAQAITARKGHNEVNISLATRGIAGTYYLLDGQKDGVDDASFPSSAVETALEPLHLPSYWLNDGMLFTRTDLDGASLETSPVPTDVLEAGAFAPDRDQEGYMREFITNRVVLPPRNPISAGVARGKFAHHYRQSNGTAVHDDFFNEVNYHLDQPALHSRLYGSIAFHSFMEQAHAQDDTVDPLPSLVHRVTEQTSTEAYRAFKSRIQDDGQLRVVRTDIDHYVSTNTLPEYLGPI
ncbi:MAG: hypothetical protein WA030_04265 [Candidatus Microsaccharimonas sp.]